VKGSKLTRWYRAGAFLRGGESDSPGAGGWWGKNKKSKLSKEEKKKASYIKKGGVHKLKTAGQWEGEYNHQGSCGG